MKLRRKIFNFAKSLIRQRNLLTYKLHGRRPWRRGYFEYKWGLIKQVLSETETIDAFKKQLSLPEGFGHGIDERIVEYPWLLANLSANSGKLLDAGSALNFETILSQSSLVNKKITIVTLHPETSCFWQRGISYLFDDLRHLPLSSDYFDVITCLSTLEHIGMDNTRIYTDDTNYKENKAEDYLLAVQEMKRVLKPGGSLFLTVPFGKYHNYGFFQQFNQTMINQVVAIFGADKSTTTFYKYSSGGWQLSKADDCADVEYITADRAKLDTRLPAAATAVACLKLTK